VRDRGFYGGFGGYFGEGEMKKLTEQTGGRVINVGNKFDKLKEASIRSRRVCAANTTSDTRPPNTNQDAVTANLRSSANRTTRFSPGRDTTPRAPAAVTQETTAAENSDRSVEVRSMID